MATKIQLPELELRIAKLQIDLTQKNINVQVQAALIDPTTGATHAWIPANSTVWSKRTGDALRKLFQCLEEDIAATKGRGEDGVESNTQALSGLAEHLGGGRAPDAPEM